jgi:catecholate siderophore receptor
VKIKIKRKKDKKERQSSNGPKYWIAMGTLAAYTTFSTRTSALAAPQKTRGTSKRGDTQAQSLSVRHFDIPAGPLDAAARVFERLADVRVVFASDDIGNIASPGVSGLYTVDQALQKLLAATSVSYRFTAGETVVFELRGPDSSVDVTERAPLSSPKYTEPLRDIPQTITVISKSMMDEQGATTLRDVLRNVPGLTMTAGEGGTAAGDNLTLRGFSARNDIFVDSVRDISPQSRDPFNLEQVEVVKGPGSAFTGRGSTGGSINLVSKWPTLNRMFGGTLNFGTDGTKRVSTDVNVPLPFFGEHAAFRLNLLAHDSGVAGRDVVNNQRWGAAPSLAFGLGTPTRLTLGYFKLKQDNISDYGIPWVPATNNVLREYRDKPAPVPRETFYGFRSRDYERMGADMATVRFEHDFSDALQVRNQLRYGRSTRDSNATPPRFASNDSTVINRELRAWTTEDGIWDNQSDLRANFATGPIKHALIAGVAFTNENNIRRTRTAPNSPTTLLNPNPDDIYAGVITTSPLVGDITGNTQALYAFDTVKFGEKFEVNGGMRWERFDVEGVTTALAPVARVDKMNSLRGAVIFKPKQSGSVYASYGTSLNPSLEGLSYNTANTAIEPEKTYTTEVGTKWDLIGARLSVNGALFRVEKTNARTPGLLPDDPPQVLQGRQRVSGVELGASGSFSRSWKIFGAYTLLDSEIEESNTPAEVGKRIQNAPRNSFNVWSTYQFKKLTVGGGPRFVGRRFGNNINTRQVASYWTLDALAAYPITSKLDLRLNLYNANDAYYFDRLGGGHLVPGAGRSVMLSTNFRF